MLKKPSRNQLIDSLRLAKEGNSYNSSKQFFSPIVRPLSQIVEEQIESDESSEEAKKESKDNFVLPPKITARNNGSNGSLFTIEELMGIAENEQKSGASSMRISLFQSEVFETRNISEEELTLEQSNESFSQNQFRLFANGLGYDIDE